MSEKLATNEPHKLTSEQLADLTYWVEAVEGEMPTWPHSESRLLGLQRFRGTVAARDYNFIKSDRTVEIFRGALRNNVTRRERPYNKLHVSYVESDERDEPEEFDMWIDLDSGAYTHSRHGLHVEPDYLPGSLNRVITVVRDVNINEHFQEQDDQT